MEWFLLHYLYPICVPSWHQNLGLLIYPTSIVGSKKRTFTDVDFEANTAKIERSAIVERLMFDRANQEIAGEVYYI